LIFAVFVGDVLMISFYGRRLGAVANAAEPTAKEPDTSKRASIPEGRRGGERLKPLFVVDDGGNTTGAILVLHKPTD
jgi:hypothetical protein